MSGTVWTEPGQGATCIEAQVVRSGQSRSLTIAELLSDALLDTAARPQGDEAARPQEGRP